jgi:hypothetical protein
MKTDQEPEAVPVFLEALTSEVSKVKNRLQQQYEQVYPDLGDIIRYVIDEEEASAWNLSPSFPHLALPELVEAHMALLGLQPFSNSSDNVLKATTLYGNSRASNPGGRPNLLTRSNDMESLGWNFSLEAFKV